MSSVNYRPYPFLIIIVTSASLLRVSGHDWGLEYSFHPDEQRIISGIWKSYWGEPVAESDYGMLPMHIMAAVWKLYGLFDSSFAASPTTGPQMLLAMRISRLCAAAVSVIGVTALYIYCLRRYGLRFAVIAATLLCLSPLGIQLSHFITVDNFLITFTVFAVFSLVDWTKNPNLKNILTSGVWVGACLSTKLSSIPLLSAGLLIIAATNFEWKLTRSYLLATLKNTLIFATTAMLVFIIVHPESIRFRSFFMLDRTDPFWWQCCKFPQGIHKFEWNLLLSRGIVQPLWALASSDLSLATKLANFLWGLGPAPILGLMGVWQIRILRFPGFRSILCMLSLCGFAAFQSHVFFTRYAAIIIPMVVLTSTIGFVNLLSAKPVFTRWLIGFAFLTSFLHSVSIASIYQQKDSRVAVGDWISDHIAIGSTICIEDDKSVVPVLDIADFKTKTMPMYQWDSLWRPQVDLAHLETIFDGVTEIPARPEAEYFKSQMDQLQEICSVLVISDRFLDHVPRLAPDHPVKVWYQKLQTPDDFQTVAKFVSFPRIGPFVLNDHWVEHTLRMNDHPTLFIIQKRS